MDTMWLNYSTYYLNVASDHVLLKKNDPKHHFIPSKHSKARKQRALNRIKKKN